MPRTGDQRRPDRAFTCRWPTAGSQAASVLPHARGQGGPSNVVGTSMPSPRPAHGPVPPGSTKPGRVQPSWSPGSNPVAAFRAIVSCLGADASIQNVLTDPVPATTGPATAGGGNAEIEADLTLPQALHRTDRLRHEPRRRPVRGRRRLTLAPGFPPFPGAIHAVAPGPRRHLASKFGPHGTPVPDARS